MNDDGDIPPRSPERDQAILDQLDELGIGFGQREEQQEEPE